MGSDIEVGVAARDDGAVTDGQFACAAMANFEVAAGPCRAGPFGDGRALAAGVPCDVAVPIRQRSAVAGAQGRYPAPGTLFCPTDVREAQNQWLSTIFCRFSTV